MPYVHRVYLAGRMSTSAGRSSHGSTSISADICQFGTSWLAGTGCFLSMSDTMSDTPHTRSVSQPHRDAPHVRATHRGRPVSVNSVWAAAHTALPPSPAAAGTAPYTASGRERCPYRYSVSLCTRDTEAMPRRTYRDIYIILILSS